MIAKPSLHSLGKNPLVYVAIGAAAFWLGSHVVSSNAARTSRIPVETVQSHEAPGYVTKTVIPSGRFAAPRIEPAAPDADTQAGSTETVAPASPPASRTSAAQSAPAPAPAQRPSPKVSAQNSSAESPAQIPAAKPLAQTALADTPATHRRPRRAHRVRQNAGSGADSAQRTPQDYRDVYDRDDVDRDVYAIDRYDVIASNDEKSVRRDRDTEESARRYRVAEERARRYRDIEEPVRRYRVSDEPVRRYRRYRDFSVDDGD